MNEKGEENYKKYKNKSLLKIGIIGNANKGKLKSSLFSTPV